MQWYIQSITILLFVVVIYMARTNDSKIDHVELLKLTTSV